MIKLLALVNIFFLLVSCEKSSTWYSDINKELIIKDDSEFFLNKEKNDPKFIGVLKNFKNSLIKKDTNELYKYQTKTFQNIVSKSIYENEILGKTDLPSEIYFSRNSLIFGDKSITVKVFYVYKNKSFSYCVESRDIWVIENDGNWKFVSNVTPWGSSITKQ